MLYVLLLDFIVLIIFGLQFLKPLITEFYSAFCSYVLGTFLSDTLEAQNNISYLYGKGQLRDQGIDKTII